jgi:sigma-E factor negative regulatory protein RseA
MKDRISTLMDGELDDRSAAQLIEGLGRDRESMETWRSYHLIGDAMRDTRLLSPGFTSRLSEKLAAEPTVIAPRRIAAESRRWFSPLPVAASVAAVSLVGWLALNPPQQGGPLVDQVAKAPSAPAPVQAPMQPVAQIKPATVPLPTAANDYLLAHQGFSPRLSLQGMAPYVRTVSEQAREPAR